MRENKKGKILNIAARHFSRYGYANASLEEIAAESGVTKPAIYYHFKDKSDLYEAVLTDRLSQLAWDVETVSDTADTPQVRLRRYIETFGSFLETHPCFAAILSHEFADNGTQLPESAADALANILQTLTAILNDGVEQGVFAIKNPIVIQMMIVSTLIVHQTTDKLRKRVASRIEKSFHLPPVPNIQGIARLLSHHILLAVQKEPT
ncbi:MAG: TetR/AcrR family transcriptional regulator [Epsilonproteobacteria bacterium]|nr:TetR/AcrR family transcriptional regulator [Campylobacterota bacterium]